MGSREILDIFGKKEDLLPEPDCKGFRNIIIKAIFYTFYIFLTIAHALLLRDIYMAQYTFLNNTIIYLGGTYFTYMIVALLHCLNLFVLAGLLTNFNGMPCAKEVIIETAFFFKDKSIKYQTYLVIVLTLAFLPVVLSYSLMPYLLINN